VGLTHGSGVLPRASEDVLVIMNEFLSYDCRQLFNRTLGMPYAYSFSALQGGSGPENEDLPAWISASGGATLKGTPADADLNANQRVWINVTMTEERAPRRSYSAPVRLVFNYRPTWVLGRLPISNKKVVMEGGNQSFSFSYADSAEDADVGDVLTYDVNWNETWMQHDKPAKLMYGDIPPNFNTSFTIKFSVRDSQLTRAARVITFYPDEFVRPRLKGRMSVLVDSAYNPQIGMPMEESTLFDILDGAGIGVHVGGLNFYIDVTLPDWLAFDPEAQTLTGAPGFVPAFDFDDIQVCCVCECVCVCVCLCFLCGLPCTCGVCICMSRCPSARGTPWEAHQ
jgi:hypothetical protein